MGRRHDGHKFMPGKFVFPGGRAERADAFAPFAANLRPEVEAALIARTSREQAPTPEGLRFHADAQRILADLDEAETAVGGAARAMAGPIRITAPVAFARAPVRTDMRVSPRSVR